MRRPLLSCLAVAIGSATGAGALHRGATLAGAGVSATPLRKVSSTRAPIGDYFAWAGPVLCDDSENAYFVVLPPFVPRKTQDGAAGPAVPEPRDVLRVSADGKKTLIFSPASVSKFANADELKTFTIALDPDGGLSVLLWARWGESGPSEKSGQYIVSFDKKGEYRSHFEVDWREILVDQFEVFGSGQFLVRGRRPDRPEPRLVILSASGSDARDVIAWPGLYKNLEEPLPGSGMVKFDQIARGGDGRIYIAQLDARAGEDVVYAFRPSGDSEEVFMLRRIPKAPRLLAWKTSGDRFAAAYLRPDLRAKASPGELWGDYWIAVYNNPIGAGDLEPTIYGPAPGPPICYRHEEAGERFTFLQGGSLVTMSAP
jgi:hypothetical protein